MLNALDPKLSCSCQEIAAVGVASDPAAAAVHGCFLPVADSAAATVSGSQDVPLATASDFPRPPGDTRCQSQVSCGDNRCGADVGTPADCTRFVEDDKRRVETNDDSKDNGGAGSSRLLRDEWDESLRRIENTTGPQACEGKTNLETAVESLPRPRRPGLSLDHWLRPGPAKTDPFFAGVNTIRRLETK
jgi:hypothetical protein